MTTSPENSSNPPTSMPTISINQGTHQSISSPGSTKSAGVMITHQEKTVVELASKRLPKGLERLSQTMNDIDLHKGSVGYKPHPPVDNGMVIWARDHIREITEMVSRPEPKDKDHRRMLGLLIGKFMSIYSVPSPNNMGEENFKTLAKRQELIAKGLLDDLSGYPLWSVSMGLQAYRQSADGKWALKTSGELLPYITSAYNEARRALMTCNRVIDSNKAGHNIDDLRSSLFGLVGKERAHRALDIMAILERATNIGIDTLAKPLHDLCYHTFHEWRRENPLPILKGASDEVS